MFETLIHLEERCEVWWLCGCGGGCCHGGHGRQGGGGGGQHAVLVGGGGGVGGRAAGQAGPGLAPAPGPRVGGHLGRDAGHSTKGDSSNGQLRPFDFSIIIFSLIYLWNGRNEVSSTIFTGQQQILSSLHILCCEIKASQKYWKMFTATTCTVKVSI